VVKGERPEGPAREWVARAFTRIEDVVYVGLGLLLAASAIALLVNAGIVFARMVSDGGLARFINVLDQLLLVLMIVEVLYTVQVSFRQHALMPEPFLVVGLIAVVRRILVLTAEFSKLIELGDEGFRNAMIELGLLTVLVVALVASLAVLRRRGPVRTG
jgi:uncharacterized membrane protein (DUF373 family)